MVMTTHKLTTTVLIGAAALPLIIPAFGVGVLTGLISSSAIKMLAGTFL